MNKIYRFMLMSMLTIVLCFGNPQSSSAQTSNTILISMDTGNSWDWMTGVKPLYTFPGQTRWWDVVRALNNPFNVSPLHGKVQLQVVCCMDMASRAPVTPRGLSLRVVPSPGCQFPPVPLGQASHLVCPVTIPPISVDVAPTTPGIAYLIVNTAWDAPPGDYIATIVADSTLGRSTKEVFISVLPSMWPANGRLPSCSPILPSIPLASFDAFNWKYKNPDKTTFSVGIGFARVGGLEFTVASGGTMPVARNTATVTFTNAVGWPVGIHTLDSRNCSSGPQFVVPAGTTTTFSLNSTTTTTLVFSKSTCRAYINLFDCWGRSALGLDDILIFSEGPFWTLFGGRTVNISTVGDWGSIPTPTSIATIRTPE